MSSISSFLVSCLALKGWFCVGVWGIVVVRDLDSNGSFGRSCCGGWVDTAVFVRAGVGILLPKGIAVNELDRIGSFGDGGCTDNPVLGILSVTADVVDITPLASGPRTVKEGPGLKGV